MPTSNESNTSDLLCHYTTVETAYKILDSSCLWATDHRFLDDYSEGQFLIDNFLKVLKQDKNLNDTCFRLLLDDLRRFQGYISSFTQFSSEPERRKIELLDGNLTLARYFGFNEWVGIVFKEEKLWQKYDKLHKDHGIPAVLRPNIAYHNPSIFEVLKFKDLIDEIFNENFGKNLQEIYKNLSKNNDAFYSKENFNNLVTEYSRYIILKAQDSTIDLEAEFQKVTDIVYPLLVGATMATKHDGFYMEKEKRFCFICFKDFEPEGNVPVKKNLYDNKILKLTPKPHLEVPIDLSAIDSIIIGPSPHKDQTQIHLEEFRMLHKLQFKIVKSTVPWRAKQYV